LKSRENASLNREGQPIGLKSQVSMATQWFQGFQPFNKTKTVQNVQAVQSLRYVQAV
jgi:hypothetical protein